MPIPRIAATIALPEGNPEPPALPHVAVRPARPTTFTPTISAISIQETESVLLAVPRATPEPKPPAAPPRTVATSPIPIADAAIPSEALEGTGMRAARHSDLPRPADPPQIVRVAGPPAMETTPRLSESSANPPASADVGRSTPPREAPAGRESLPVDARPSSPEIAALPRLVALDAEAARRNAARRIERFVAVRTLETTAPAAPRAEAAPPPRVEPAPSPSAAPPERAAETPLPATPARTDRPRAERLPATPAPPPSGGAAGAARAPLPEPLLPAAGASAIEAAILAKARALPSAGTVELRFALEPENLGNVRVRMEARGTSLKVELAPSTPAGVDLLSAAAGRLAESLRQAGFPDAQVAVALDLPKDGRRDDAAPDRAPAPSRAASPVLPRSPAAAAARGSAGARSLLDRTV